jgi:hypothetical protein
MSGVNPRGPRHIAVHQGVAKLRTSPMQQRVQPAPPDRMRGLGDLIAKVADPIGKAIGLDKAKCGCAKRQERLNRLVPFRKG